MAKKSSYLTSRGLSDITGIPVQTVNRLLREGRIKGVKASGKWRIDRGELNAEVVKALSKTAGRQESPRPASQELRKKENNHLSQSARQTYSVAEFSSLTYLTEAGVVEFIKKGRLQGVKDDKGNWLLGHENLQNPKIHHLIR